MPRYLQQRSAGGAVFKQDGDGFSVLLIKPRDRDRWQLPKGTIDPGESSEVTAVREVREEAGVEVSVIARLEPVTFFYQMHGRRYVKTVDFYLMRFRSGSPEDHDWEVDDARWFPASDALSALTFESERGVVRAALEHLDQRPASTAS